MQSVNSWAGCREAFSGAVPSANSSNCQHGGINSILGMGFSDSRMLGSTPRPTYLVLVSSDPPEKSVFEDKGKDVNGAFLPIGSLSTFTHLKVQKAACFTSTVCCLWRMVRSGGQSQTSWTQQQKTCKSIKFSLNSLIFAAVVHWSVWSLNFHALL